MRNGGSWVLGVVVVMAVGSGCAGARMRVDSAVSDASDEWSVDGANPRRWGEPLRVGLYRAAWVNDGATLGWSAPVLGLRVASSRRPYAWTMTGAGATVDAECHETGLDAVTPAGLSVDVQGASGRPVLACAFRATRADGAERTWTLALRATGRPVPAYAGTLRDGSGDDLVIASSHELERSAVPLGEPAGYAFSRGAEKVAVVETIGDGRVLVAHGAAEPHVLAAASAALLLFHPPGE
jgi:hypothetical protein